MLVIITCVYNFKCRLHRVILVNELFVVSSRVVSCVIKTVAIYYIMQKITIIKIIFVIICQKMFTVLYDSGIKLISK